MYRLANAITCVFGAAHFSQSTSTLKSGDTGLTLNIWQRVIEERQVNIIHATISGISKQRAGSKCVCSGATSRDSTAIKEAVSCNCDLTHPSSFSFPPPPPPAPL